jgi:hypothetical protein
MQVVQQQQQQEVKVRINHAGTAAAAGSEG